MLPSFNSLTHSGKKAEEYVVTWLLQQGFSIVAQNYRQRYGEIDIIAKKDNVISFIEVKYRTNLYFNVSEVIVPSKQRKIIKVAKTFIARHSYGHNIVYRFDIAIVTKAGTELSLDYYPNAFIERN